MFDFLMLGWLEVFIPAFLGFALLGGLLLYVSHRLSSAVCPACLRSVPKNGLKLGMPCPECEDVPSDSTSRPQDRNTGCQLCARVHGVTFLWDGKGYCRDCLCNVSGELFTAASDPVWSEELPYEITEVANRALWYYGRFAVGFSVFWGLGALPGGNLRDGLWICGIFLSIGIPVCLLWTLATALSFPLAKTKSMIWSGNFMVRVGSHLRVVPLKDIAWRVGERSEHTVSIHGFALRGSAVIVELPRSVAGDENCVAVGCTPRQQEILKAFFTIAEVPVAFKKRKRGSFAIRPRRSRNAG